MSLKTWKEEFYPVPASGSRLQKKNDAALVEHALLKWEGLSRKNLVTPEKSKVAETLDEFRGNHRYNLLDDNVRRFNASISQFVIWDDHEVLNNWYPTEILGADMPHSEHSVALLAARAKRAFQEYTPMRFEPSDPERIYRAIRFGPLVEILGWWVEVKKPPPAHEVRDRFLRLTESVLRS